MNLLSQAVLGASEREWSPKINEISIGYRFVERLKNVLALLDIRCVDYIIVSPKEQYSSAAHGLL